MAAISAFHSQSFLQTLSIKLNVSIRKKGFPFKPNEVVHRFQIKNRKDR